MSDEVEEGGELSRADLVRLLGYLEGELQARDVAIAVFKAEKAKRVLYQAKYGRLGLSDPLAALQRDSDTLGAVDDFDEAAVGKMYESQLAQLERLIAVQRHSHHRAKQVLASTERRHARTLRELETARERSRAEAAQGDDVCAMLEKDRGRLRRELEQAKEEIEKGETAIRTIEENFEKEKQRHKAMMLFLINERKQLLLRLHQMGMNHPTSEEAKNLMVNELRREVALLRMEKDRLASALNQAQADQAVLRETVRSQEEDLALIRHNILANTRIQTNQLARLDRGEERSLVVANRAAATMDPAKSRLSSSSSFPSSSLPSSSRGPPIRPSSIAPRALPILRPPSTPQPTRTPPLISAHRPPLPSPVPPKKSSPTFSSLISPRRLVSSTSRGMDSPVAESPESRGRSAIKGSSIEPEIEPPVSSPLPTGKGTAKRSSSLPRSSASPAGTLKRIFARASQDRSQV